MKSIFWLAFILLLFSSCEQENNLADAYGNFEAPEVIVSAETGGKLIFFDLEEGQRLKSGHLVGIVDTFPLHLKKLQLHTRLVPNCTHLQSFRY